MIEDLRSVISLGQNRLEGTHSIPTGFHVCQVGKLAFTVLATIHLHQSSLLAAMIKGYGYF